MGAVPRACGDVVGGENILVQGENKRIEGMGSINTAIGYSKNGFC